MRTTLYFQTIRHLPDQAWIRDEWIQRTVATPGKESMQTGGRIRRWRRIPEAEARGPVSRWRNRAQRLL